MHIHHKIDSQLAGLQLCAYCIHIIYPVFKVSEWQLIQMGASLRMYSPYGRIQQDHLLGRY